MRAHRPTRYDRLMARGDALPLHFELGLHAYAVGEVSVVARHRAAVGILPEGGANSVEFLALRWRELWLMNEPELALEVAREATRRFPDMPECAVELADIYVDLERYDQAYETLRTCVEENEDNVDLWYEVGLAAERLEAWEARRDAFTRVWQMEHEREPTHRLFLSEEGFIAAAEETLERLPETTRQALGNVVIMVEDYPDEWILESEAADPRLLGLFSGPSKAFEGASDYLADGPAMIHLFRWNIERVAATAQEAIEQVEITVLHEIGHYLGLDEEALHARGLG